jgi:hypothetical protein
LEQRLEQRLDQRLRCARRYPYPLPITLAPYNPPNPNPSPSPNSDLSGIEAAIHDIAYAVRAVDRRLAAIEGGEPADKQSPGAAA